VVGPAGGRIAQDLGDTRRGIFFGRVPGEDFDAGAEDVGFLLVEAFRLQPASRPARRRGNQPGAGAAEAGQAHAASRASMTAPGSKPIWAVISTMQVGLVTLISVSGRHDHVEADDQQAARPQDGAEYSAMARSPSVSGIATAAPPAARPPVSPAIGMRAPANRNDLARR
jgi:hypothetical protein